MNKIIALFLAGKKNKKHISNISPAFQKTIFLLFLYVAFSCNVIAAEKNHTAKIKPLNLGLIPHLSSNLMIKKYSNLINYLEEVLHRPVTINTAPNFKTYVQRSSEGKFDLYMTAPHMAVYHEKHDQHIRLAKFSNNLHAVIAVTKDSPYKNITDLKGKTITAPDALAANTINGELTLINNGLDIEKEAAINYTTSNNNPLVLLSENKADAAITGLPGFKIVSRNSRLKQPLRILKTSEPIPHMMFMSPPRVSPADREAFKKALLNMPDNKTGNAFLSGLPFGHPVEVTDKDLQQLADMLKTLEQRLK